MADDTSSSSWSLDPALLQQWNATDPSVGPHGEGMTNVQQLNEFANTFAQLYQNMTGQPPSQQVMDQYLQNAGYQQFMQPGLASYGDISQQAQAYIQNQFPQQVQAGSTANQQNQLGTTEQGLNQLVNSTMGNVASNLANPSGSTYQAFSGNMNNLGISPSSGAFQAGAGSTVANAGTNALNAGLSAVGLPALSNIQGLSSQPAQNTLNNLYPSLNNLQQETEFNQQMQMAQNLASQGQPSSFQKTFGDVTSGLNAAGNAAKGGASLAGLTWVCTAMWRHHVLAASEVDRLHKHLFRALFKRFWKFAGYFLFGKLVVWGAEWVKIDWEKWRPDFYDNVIAEPDPVKAVDLYESAFFELVETVKHKIRIKFMFLYDNPMEGRHG